MTRPVRVLLPVFILGAAVLGALVLTATGPQATPKPPEARLPNVRVQRVAPQQVQMRVSTYGTVAPRTETELVPEVSGPIVEVSPELVSGGFFEQGDVLFRIDPTDYEAALERARASAVRSASEHDRAAKDLERVLGLRERNAASTAQVDDATSAEAVAGASLREAKSALAQAERDLERTEVRAPFAGRVREERVGEGQFVTRGNPVATLYATDRVEIRLPVPDPELAFLDLPLFRGEQNGESHTPAVSLRAEFAGAEHTWTGRVVRTEGEIDPKSRMVHVVASVERPYEPEDRPERPPLAVGLFVSAEIQGRVVDDVVVLPRIALRPGDIVLVVGEDDRLEFRSVDVLRRDQSRVLIRAGLTAGERVCVSPLEAAVEGMRVRPLGEEGAAS